MAKKSAFGTQLQRLVTATWTAIAQVKDINGPSLSGETTDVTTHDSPDAFREHLSTVRDSGEVTFDLEWDPEDAAGQKFLLDSLADGSVNVYRLVFPTASDHTWSASGIVTKFEPKAPVEGSIQASVSMKITGKPNFDVT